MQIDGAAHYLGMSKSKLRELKIPSKRDGGNVLYDIRDLDRYADNLPYKEKQAESETWQRAFD